MSQELDISALEWGKPPVPLLPQTLREAWGSHELPPWLVRDLSLAHGATIAHLTGEFVCEPEAEDRVYHFVRTYVTQNIADAQRLKCFASAAPAGFQLSTVPFGTRSRRAIERSGISENPAKLFEATYGDLLGVSQLGVATLLELVALTECAAARFSQTVEACHVISETSEIGNTGPPVTLPATWRADCERFLSMEWAEKVSIQDPRFAEILPAGMGTLEERLLAVLGDPIQAAQKADALLKALPAIEERVSLIQSLTLEESLIDYLAAALKYRQDRVDLLAIRLGWLGLGPRTLQECGGMFGITRQRVSQIEKRLRDAMPKHHIYLPRLDDALTVIEEATPLDTHEAETLLMQRGICKRQFSIESLLAAAADFGRHTTASLTEVAGQRCVSTIGQSSAIGAFVRKARAVAGAIGVASVYQLADDAPVDAITQTGDVNAQPGEVWVRQTLRAWSSCKFVDEDWFTFSDLPAGRSRLLNVLDRMLAVSPQLRISDVREGLRRQLKYRSHAHRSAIELVVPPTAVLQAYLQGHPDYLVRDGHVEARIRRHVEDQLADAELAMVEVFEEAGGGVLDRRSFVEGCVRKGINANTVSVYTTYSPIIEHVGVDLWKLRGRVVDAATVEAVRQSNQERSRERRCIHFGWTSRGTLSIAWVLPWQFSSLALGIPGAVSRYLCGQTYEAYNGATDKPCGTVAVTEDATSYGYSPFLRHVAAEAGDVLMADFDVAASKVSLAITDVGTVIDSDDLSGD